MDQQRLQMIPDKLERKQPNMGTSKPLQKAPTATKSTTSTKSKALLSSSDSESGGSDSDSGSEKDATGSIPKSNQLLINAKFASKFEAESRYKDLQRNSEILAANAGDSAR